jgi:lambda repressor-like predicted transcriptional regulator
MRRRKALLAYHGVSLAQLARKIGRSQHTLSTVVNRYPEKKSRYIQERIAEILNVPYEKLWNDPPHQHESIVSSERGSVNV